MHKGNSEGTRSTYAAFIGHVMEMTALYTEKLGDNIKMDPMKIGYGNVHWIEVSQDRMNYRTCLVIMVIRGLNGRS
jgi:hypothetical protein